MIPLLSSAADLIKARYRKRWWPMRYHKIQQRLWQCTKRFVGVPAGRRSGKSELAKRKLVKQLPIIKPWSDPRYLYGAPTREQAKRLAWKDLLVMVPRGWILGEPNHTELYIETKFGSSIHVVGLDKPERYEGIPWDGGIIDESCDVKPKAIDLSIGPALVDRMGWLWRLGVPKRFGVGAAEFKEFCERAADGKDPDEASFTWPSSDIQPPEALRYFQGHMDAMDYAEQFDASWQTVSGRIFHAFTDTNKRACTFDPDAPMIISCDFNVNPMAWVVGHPRNGPPPAGYMDWFDEIWLRDTNTQKTLDELWQRYGRHTRGTMSFYGDATSKSRHTSASMSDYLQILNDPRFKAAGATVHFPDSNPAKSDRFAAGNAVLLSADGNVRNFFDPRMEHTLVDIERRGFKAGTKEPDDKGDVGHATDAWTYAIYLLFPIITSVGSGRIIIKTGSGTGKQTGRTRPRQAGGRHRRPRRGKHARR